MGSRIGQSLLDTKVLVRLNILVERISFRPSISRETRATDWPEILIDHQSIQPVTWLEPMLPGMDRFRFPDQRACLRARTLPSFSRSMYLQTHINCRSRMGDCANRDYIYSGFRVTCKILSSNPARRFNYNPIPETLSLQHRH